MSSKQLSDSKRVISTAKLIKSKADTELFSDDQEVYEIYSDESSEASDEPGKTAPKEKFVSSSISHFNFLGNSEISTENIIHGKRIRKLKIKIFNLRTTSVIDKNTAPPRNYNCIESRSDAEHWNTAYQKEVTSLEQTGHCEVIDWSKKPERVIPLVEIFKAKQSLQQQWIAKVRICANDNTQRSIYSTNDLRFYSPVATVLSTRTFIIRALNFNIPIRQVNISSAFIYGNLEK
eukprot:snap_masked-scaffold_30-processed-gene-2.37-mRNA-1 protein AED:0.86 eAED:0.86 QI:0/-1/0/1/-1/1/1/0/233